MSTTIRPLSPSDSIDALTALLHRAYAPLGAMGLNYTAVDQSVDTTARRFADGHGFVAEQGGVVVGTVVVNGPRNADETPDARVCAWYLRRDVAHLHQLGVEPALQGRGIGNALIAACERWAAGEGFRAIALDTAMPATHLRQRYAALGYAEVGDVQWTGKRYRTVIMVKPLSGDAPTADDAEHRCALVRALWAHVQARDWAAVRATFAADATLDWPCTGERLVGADVIVRVNAEYPEGWTIRVHAVDALADCGGKGRVHSVIEVIHPPHRFFAHSRFAFDGPRIASVIEHWGQVEAPPAWRTAEAFGPGYQRI
jgi:GNAT superfamily N-acetyltransferase